MIFTGRCITAYLWWFVAILEQHPKVMATEVQLNQAMENKYGSHHTTASPHASPRRADEQGNAHLRQTRVAWVLEVTAEFFKDLSRFFKKD